MGSKEVELVSVSVLFYSCFYKGWGWSQKREKGQTATAGEMFLVSRRGFDDDDGKGRGMV